MRQFKLLIKGKEVDTQKKGVIVRADDVIKNPDILKKFYLLKKYSGNHNWLLTAFSKRIKIDPKYVYAEYPIASTKENVAAVLAARDAFDAFEEVTPETRVDILKSWREKIKANEAELKELAIVEGLTYSSIEWELNALYNLLTDENLEFFTKLANPIPDRRVKGTYFIKHPLGVVGIVTPYNAAVILDCLVVINQIISGNTGVIKVSSSTPMSSLFIFKLLQDSLNEHNAPKGVINVIIGKGTDIVNEWITNRYIDCLVFFGSSGAGVNIGKKCIKQGIKPVLELAGSDACIVNRDADLDKAADAIVRARFLGAGQICISIKRLYAHKNIYDDLVEKIIGRVKKLKIGLPSDPDVDIIPVANKKAVIAINEALEEAKHKGAKIEYGGYRVDHYGNRNSKGLYLVPTIVTGVDHNMKVMKNEMFGPVLPIMKFSNIYEAIDLANDTQYGLRASLWTNDKEIIKKVFRKLYVASVIVNDDHLYLDGDVAHLGGYKLSSATNNGAKYFVNEMMGYKFVNRRNIDIED